MADVFDWAAEGDGVAVATKPEGYNGWANYETWSVALIVDNDEPLYHLRRELVAEAAETALGEWEAGDVFTEAEAVRYGVADALKAWITGEGEEAIVTDRGGLAYLWAQLLGAAMSEVDWSELADAWTAELAEGGSRDAGPVDRAEHGGRHHGWGRGRRPGRSRGARAQLTPAVGHDHGGTVAVH